MTKEQQTIKKIIDIITSDEFEIGSPLPSERKLSHLFKVSRNTVRSVLHKLEARGILDIRSGSGCYLLCKDRHILEWMENKHFDPKKDISDLIQARYLFEPDVIFLAAKKINKESIHLLEKCIMRLSQAIITKNKDELAKEDAEFRRIIYINTNNRFLIFTMNQLLNNNPYFFNMIDMLNETEKDNIFADYVSILTALKQKDAFLVKETIKGNILRMGELLIKYKNILLTEFIKETMA